MALKSTGVSIALLSTIILVLMILNLVEVVRLENDRGSDAGIVMDKVLSSYLIILSSLMLLVLVTCSFSLNPTMIAVCMGLKGFLSLPVIRHILPVLLLTNGAYA